MIVVVRDAVLLAAFVVSLVHLWRLPDVAPDERAAQGELPAAPDAVTVQPEA